MVQAYLFIFPSFVDMDNNGFCVQHFMQVVKVPVSYNIDFQDKDRAHFGCFVASLIHSQSCPVSCDFGVKFSEKFVWFQILQYRSFNIY